jgi:hypothetical protein
VLGASTTSSAPATTGSPGVPNTGAGGNASDNAFVLFASGGLMIGGSGYLLRSRRNRLV